MHKIIHYRITKEANYVKEFSKYFKHQIYDTVICVCVCLATPRGMQDFSFLTWIELTHPAVVKNPLEAWILNYFR